MLAQSSLALPTSTQQSLKQLTSFEQGLASYSFELLNRLNREILAVSGLKSDADAITHFLVEVGYLQHPLLAQQMQTLFVQSEAVLAAGRFTPDTFLGLTDLQKQVLRILAELEQNETILLSQGSAQAK
ncbi:hypothetical protein HR060_07420 [Catenovulum sp. SM1970]|uniref:hypothetical protein n=1 Tax=Marinifaba aquimaris TaxID=2741323 RepID=UPI001573C653|nr:hypothetical protein [Marinifaba aquimaris]NTS76696.1 hypothetical protein [Marinifaba aquimaris]